MSPATARGAIQKSAAILLVFVVTGAMLAGPASGQSGLTVSSPKEVSRAFLETVIIPTYWRRPPSEVALSAFYNASLSALTRAQVTEDQFVAHWKQEAGRRGRYPAKIEYVLFDPSLNESQDRALVPFALTYTYTLTPPQMVGAIYLWPLTLFGLASCRARCNEDYHTEGLELIVKEVTDWRLVLQASTVRAMQALPTTSAVKRYAPLANETSEGVALRVLEVTVSPDGVTIAVTVRNGNDRDMDLADAAAGALLADENGKEYSARPVSTTLPATLRGQAEATARLLFPPLSGEVTTLRLTMPDIQIDERRFTLNLTIPLKTQDYPTYGGFGIPAEPALAYVLAARVLGRGAKPEDAMRDIYTTYLAAQIREQVHIGQTR